VHAVLRHLDHDGLPSVVYSRFAGAWIGDLTKLRYACRKLDRLKAAVDQI
jgi:hypothetical protein